VQEVDFTVLPFCWGAKGGKYRVDVGTKGQGIENHTDKVLIEFSKVPDDVEAILIVGTVRANRTDDTVFSGLETATISIRACNTAGEGEKEKEGKSKASSKSKVKSPSSASLSSYYDLATYTTTHTDVGASGSIVMGKIYRRSLEAPWEFLPIGVGSVEVSIDDLLSSQAVAGRNQFIAVGDGARGLSHFVRIGWRPIPKHCKVYLLDGSGLAPHPRTQGANPFVTLEAAPKSGYTFETKQSNVCSGTVTPSWNELFVFKDIGTHSKSDVPIMVTVWDYDPIGSYDYMGDCKVNLKKCFLESVRNGGRGVDMTFTLQKGGRKKVGLSAATTQRLAITGEIKLRFLCF